MLKGYLKGKVVDAKTAPLKAKAAANDLKPTPPATSSSSSVLMFFVPIVVIIGVVYTLLTRSN